MSSLALSINRGGGGGGGQQIRRQRSTSSNVQKRRSTGSAHLTSQMNTRMSLASSIQTSSRRPKSYTQTLVEQRSKSKRLSSMSSRQKLVYTPTPMALLSTSARKDPTLARNKYLKQRFRAVDDRADFGTTRAVQESARDGVDDHPQIVTIIEPQEPEPEIIDMIGNAVMNVNDAMVKMIFDNEAVTKTIFPYVDGTYYPRMGDDFPEESSVDFYTGMNHTLSEEGFEATPTSMHTTQTNDVAVAASAAGAAGAAGAGEKPKNKTGKLGILMKRQKKVKKNKEGVGTTNESQHNEAETQGLTQEAVTLLSFYEKAKSDFINCDLLGNVVNDVANQEPETDDRDSTKEAEQVNDESTIVKGQDVEVEMLGDRNVLAIGIGAFAVCGGDDNTIVPSDELELTLQDYTQMEHIPAVAKKLNQKKRAKLRKMKARNLRAAQKALVQEPKSKQASRSKPVLVDDNTTASTLPLQEERALDSNSNEKKNMHTEEPFVVDDNTILTSENRECNLDDYSKPRLLQRISSFKSKQNSHVKPTLEDDNTILTSENREVALNDFSAKPGSVSSNASSTDKKSVESKASTISKVLSQVSILKSFEVDDGISMQSSLSMATGLRSDGPGRQRSYPRTRSRMMTFLSRYSHEESDEEDSRFYAEEEEDSESYIDIEERLTEEEDSIDIRETFTEESETSSMK